MAIHGRCICRSIPQGLAIKKGTRCRFERWRDKGRENVRVRWPVAADEYGKVDGSSVFDINDFANHFEVLK